MNRPADDRFPWEIAASYSEWLANLLIEHKVSRVRDLPDEAQSQKVERLLEFFGEEARGLHEVFRSAFTTDLASDEARQHLKELLRELTTEQQIAFASIGGAHEYAERYAAEELGTR